MQETPNSDRATPGQPTHSEDGTHPDLDDDSRLLDDDATHPDDDPTETLSRPSGLAERPDVRSLERTRDRDGEDHCGADRDGVAVAGVRDDDGALLVLLHDERGIAILPHGTVDAGGDWAAAARDGVSGLTGFEATFDAVRAVRTVTHRVDGEVRTRTHQVIYEGSLAGGTIDDCKRDADAGSDGWRAAWIQELPDGIVAPDGSGGADLRLVLEGETP